MAKSKRNARISRVACMHPVATLLTGLLGNVIPLIARVGEKGRHVRIKVTNLVTEV